MFLGAPATPSESLLRHTQHLADVEGAEATDMATSHGLWLAPTPFPSPNHNLTFSDAQGTVDPRMVGGGAPHTHGPHSNGGGSFL